MKIQEIRKIAKQWNVDARIGRDKADVIRDIQMREGYTPCFGTKAECDEYVCLWREDCLK
ncbi:MAG: SAP domain-containing protein [Deltaproteobacteria bacterium]|nr:SAP domain-containing protein [Deltaproteobacteria bacterium]